MSMQIGREYFEGYEEKFINTPKGLRKVRVYLGDKYRRENKGDKPKFLGLVLAYFALLLWSGVQRTPATVSAYVMLPYAVGLFFGGYCAIGVYHALTAPRDMTVFQYNEQHRQLKVGSMVALCAMGGAVVIHIVCLALWLTKGFVDSQQLPRELMVLFSNLTCAVFMALIHLLEKKSVYTVTPGKGSDQSNDWAENMSDS